jgi:hypothetical protein
MRSIHHRFLLEMCCALLLLTVGSCSLFCVPRSVTGTEWPASSPAVQSATIPAGYLLPARLEHTLDVEQARAGDAIAARITQEVPLPGRAKIDFRSMVQGSILHVARDTDETGVELTIRFDAVVDHRESLPVVIGLRAIASRMAVHEAQIPRAVYDEQTPLSWATTYQIGGDERFGDGGAVRNRWSETVGKAVRGGVLVHAKADPQRGCADLVGADDHPQALWLFSADACGVYGMKELQLVHDGESSPTGEITLHFKKADMKLSAGTGLLLSVVAAR